MSYKLGWYSGKRSALTITMSSPEVCRGLPECDCEYYQPNPNPQSGERALCIECQHGKSKHPRASTSNVLPAPTTAASKPSVLALFKKINSADFGKENKYDVTSKEDARKEMLRGYRPQAQAGLSGSSSSKKTQKVPKFLV